MDQKKKPQKSVIFNNEGFTLLEIIAVLVIMSILAVVAVPRYFNLQEDARRRAFGVGISEARGRVNSYFASRILQGDTPCQVNYSIVNLGGPDIGDFMIAISNSTGTSFRITVTGKIGTEMEGVEGTFTNGENVLDIPRPGVDPAVPCNPVPVET